MKALDHATDSFLSAENSDTVAAFERKIPVGNVVLAVATDQCDQHARREVRAQLGDRLAGDVLSSDLELLNVARATGSSIQFVSAGRSIRLLIAQAVASVGETVSIRRSSNAETSRPC